MKKSVILTICIIYIFAILIVGFLGQPMKVYGEKVYVDDIECVNKEFNKDTNSIQKIYQEGLVYNLKCIVKPENATEKKLDYIGEDSNKGYELVYKEEDNSVNIVFLNPTTATIIVKATDTQGIYIIIKITAVDAGSII